MEWPLLYLSFPSKKCSFSKLFDQINIFIIDSIWFYSFRLAKYMKICSMISLNYQNDSLLCSIKPPLMTCKNTFLQINVSKKG